jgi:hypothetical protein
MKQLVHDAGIDHYSTVRKAYDRAREILADEMKRRAELQGLLAIIDDNKEGVEWLRLEEDSFDAVYRHFQEHLSEDRQKPYNPFRAGTTSWFPSGIMTDVGTGMYEGYIRKKYLVESELAPRNSIMENAESKVDLMKLKEEQQEQEKYLKSKMKKSRWIMDSLLGKISNIANLF